MAILARFRVNSVETFGSGSRPKLIPVYSPEEYESPEVLAEVRSFFEATPMGNLEMFIRSEAAEQFQPDDEFYVTLEKVPHDQTSKAISQRRVDKLTKEKEQAEANRRAAQQRRHLENLGG